MVFQRSLAKVALGVLFECLGLPTLETQLFGRGSPAKSPSSAFNLFAFVEMVLFLCGRSQSEQLHKTCRSLSDCTIVCAMRTFCLSTFVDLKVIADDGVVLHVSVAHHSCDIHYAVRALRLRFRF